MAPVPGVVRATPSGSDAKATLTAMPPHLEEEIKLTAPNQATLDAILQDAWVGSVAGGRSVEDRPYLAVYYDTPGKDLLRHRWGLRMSRVADGGWQVELKGKGSLVAGVARHEEWGVYHSAPIVHLGDLPPGPLRDRVLAVASADSVVVPLLTTHFQRRTLLLELSAECRAELALDAGIISAGNREMPLFEVELESLAGPFAPIQAFADELTRRHPLTPATMTKFHRGVALLDCVCD
ncbi:MAG: CYTH domain-containing protein [Magnetococcales bacterium]|nr:CYTH domain-containing protein [Magnetococcales bacterium]